MRSPWAIDNDPRIGEANAQLVLGPVEDPARPMAGRHHEPGTDTERTAAARVTPRSGTQRAKVLDALRWVAENPDKGQHGGGLTDYELHDLFGIGARPHVPGTRREELIADGWPIVDSGRRRPTDTGSPAIVWVLR